MTIRIGKWQKAPGFTPKHLFAIGDVHGMMHLFQPLHQHAIQSGAHVLQLGDLIDRGPSSIDALRWGLQHGTIPGNHEQMLLAAMRQSNGNRVDLLRLSHWISQGGRAVIKELDPHGTKKEPEAIAEMIEHHLGDDLDQLIQLPSHHRIGSYVFVHAGMPAGISRDEQNTFLNKNWRIETKQEQDSMLWIRSGFLHENNPYPDGSVVVHGHTIEQTPSVLPHRIGIDQGAYKHGILTGVELIQDRLRFHFSS